MCDLVQFSPTNPLIPLTHLLRHHHSGSHAYPPIEPQAGSQVPIQRPYLVHSSRLVSTIYGVFHALLPSRLPYLLAFCCVLRSCLRFVWFLPLSRSSSILSLFITSAVLYAYSVSFFLSFFLLPSLLPAYLPYTSPFQSNTTQQPQIPLRE